MIRIPLLLLCCFLSIAFFGQVLPANNDFPELGLRFQIPDGWTAEQRGETVVMGHQSIAGLIILSGNESESAEMLRVEAMKGMVDQGIHLSAIGDFSISNGNKVSGFYEGTWEGAEVKCYAIALINSLGSGVNLLAVTTTELFGAQHEAELNKLAASVEFYQPVVVEQTVQWKRKLVPSKIEYLSSSYSSDYVGGSSGTSDRERITLCSNGYFDYYSNSQSTFSAGDGAGGEAGSGYAHNNGEGQGTYDFRTIGSETFLLLTFKSGEVYEYTLSTNREGNTFLNGTRYFVVETDYCQ